MREIDGSYGEGGGQLLRNACALAALSGEELRLFNIRARRDPPGLAPQHLMAVRAVGELCGAEVEGLTLRSQEIRFHPGRLRAGEFRFDVGTAGSIPLVLQACLPVTFACGAPVRLHVSGGTDVRAAPPLDYLRFVFLPLLARLGLHARVEAMRRGYYPRGGGEVEVAVEPGAPSPLRLESAGTLEELGGVAHVANLPLHIVERMQATAARLLARYGPVHIEPQALRPDRAIGPGGAIVVWARFANTVLGGAEVAQRGVPAERIASNAAEALAVELEAGATLDRHACDQLLVYLARARGASSFLVRELTSHARTMLWLLQQFLPLRVETRAHGALTHVELTPGTGREAWA
jgi:RNA 3'-terminal phosphate cyclase (ATP)/RNA 3'-terminal phosphate cyclase (GTP)